MPSDESLEVWAQKVLEICPSRKHQRLTGLHLLAHAAKEHVPAWGSCSCGW